LKTDAELPILEALGLQFQSYGYDVAVSCK